MFIALGLLINALIFICLYKISIIKLQLKKIESIFLASGITGLIVHFFSVIPTALRGEQVNLEMYIPFFIFIPSILFITYKRKGNILNGYVLSVFLSMFSYVIFVILD